ncbi:MAG: hypothetical protein RMX68_009255 [Aulosira sp. ZfuVER01]|nr:hypothetical protein [Aulosira sp. ZfuVER01]MDZ7998810.1 hypothetical protein [Aulosira sp. DedVER01a]MDZ8055843.1 hypothetical protein [Aulosira sp. ZfuCHP01]
MRLFNDNRQKDKSGIKGQEAFLADYHFTKKTKIYLLFIAVRLVVKQQFALGFNSQTGLCCLSTALH